VKAKTGKKTGKKTGRPLLALDARLVEGMAGAGATNLEIAHFTGAGEETIPRRFGGVLTKARSGMRLRLRQAQFKAAMAGNATMLICLGKQMLAQQDHQNISISDLQQRTDEELEAIAAGRMPAP
jgi:hypothetical protein